MNRRCRDGTQWTELHGHYFNLKHCQLLIMLINQRFQEGFYCHSNRVLNNGHWKRWCNKEQIKTRDGTGVTWFMHSVLSHAMTSSLRHLQSLVFQPSGHYISSLFVIDKSLKPSQICWEISFKTLQPGSSEPDQPT